MKISNMKTFQENKDKMTGLKAKTNAGRPNW